MPRWPNRTSAERFWEKVEKTDSCWMWTATLIQSGYGHFRVGDRMVLAHRFAYELEVGPIPERLTLDHLCRNRACVRPSHLEPVTMLENLRRGRAGAYNAEKTHCKHGHEFTPENTGNYGGKRYCRTCRRRWDREGYQRRKNGVTLPRGRPPATHGHDAESASPL